MRSYRNETKMVSELAASMTQSVKWCAVLAGMSSVGVGVAVKGMGSHWWLLVLATGLIVFCLAVTVTAALIVSVCKSVQIRDTADPEASRSTPPPRASTRAIPVLNPSTGRYEYVDVDGVGGKV